ncbi:ABC transporter permease [Parasedimentitalea huanghaiensis]|uniref:ABC transporter permease n=1 Tax=Parasedimentitalea huanghaiensis TaxID=2682100 RepID=A0A6L6WLD5_9RHOB|nr:ABC transporter permease [Zongyanglinia huanghaiensis]MVO17998.1 ABC transporter permease [Zongyanglinia huanghaiensis]
MNEVISTFIALIPVTLAQSLILSFVVLAIMIPFRILSFPDLTSEGAYPLGGAVCAIAMVSGVPAYLAIPLAVVAGFVAGCATALIHLRFKIHTLLAGILVTTMLYSVNLRILGKPNVPLFKETKLFDYLDLGKGMNNLEKILIVGLLMGVVGFGLRLWFMTERGIAMRAVGDNPDMAEAQGNNVDRAIFLGVGAAGGCAALSGSLMVQSQAFVDVNMGIGLLINALAALMIGETILGRRKISQQLLAPFVGSLIYYQLISFCLAAGLAPSDLKIATGIFVLVMLGAPILKGKRNTTRLAKESIRE